MTLFKEILYMHDIRKDERNVRKSTTTLTNDDGPTIGGRQEADGSKQNQQEGTHHHLYKWKRRTKIIKKEHEPGEEKKVRGLLNKKDRYDLWKHSVWRRRATQQQLKLIKHQLNTK